MKEVLLWCVSCGQDTRDELCLCEDPDQVFSVVCGTPSPDTACAPEDIADDEAFFRQPRQGLSPAERERLLRRLNDPDPTEWDGTT